MHACSDEPRAETLPHIFNWPYSPKPAHSYGPHTTYRCHGQQANPFILVSPGISVKLFAAGKLRLPDTAGIRRGAAARNRPDVSGSRWAQPATAKSGTGSLTPKPN